VHQSEHSRIDGAIKLRAAKGHIGHASLPPWTPLPRQVLILRPVDGAGPGAGAVDRRVAGSCVWPAPGVPEAHVELAGGRSRSVSLIIRDDRQPFDPDLPQRIKVGDELVVAPEDQRWNTEALRMSSAVRRCTAG
jgi:hypothetical protein